MQSWLPAQGSGIVVLRALSVVFFAIVQAHSAAGYESSLTFLAPGSHSTLDSRVPPQNLDLQETVLSIVDGVILKDDLPPQFQAPKNAKSASTPDITVSKSVKPLPKPVKVAEVGETKKSPFRKWVKPKSESTSDTIDEEPKPAKVARRLASTTRQPMLVPAREPDTAVASDLSKEPEVVQAPNADEIATEEEAEAVSVPENRTYLTPAAESPTTPIVRENLPPLTRSQINLRTKIRNVLTHYYNRPLNTRDRSPWELMHAMLAFEAHSKVLQGGPKGEPITAVGWLCYNQACKRRTLMYVNDDGELRVRVGPALQGHRGQLLAMLAQSRISANYPMLVEGHELKVRDLIEMEKQTCYPRTELTFKLIGLMHYLDSDATWLNDQGMQWDFPRMISEEIRQPVRGAACGGTHRLAGLTLAYKTRMRRGEPVDGEYLKAKKFVTRYQQYAYRLQNRDGSFSTEWFRGPGNEDSIDRKLKTTGHILEWLLYAATDKELKHWKTTKAANYLANIMYRNRYKDWEAGPLGHAIHALLVYDRLVFSPYDPPNVLPMATKSQATSRRR